MYPSFDATERFELLEIQIPANTTQTRFNIPDQPQLRTDQDADIIIQGIDVYNVLEIPLSANGVAVVSVADMAKTFLTLYVDQEESIYRIPLVQMHRIRNAGATDFYAPELQRFRNIQVDWTKSYFYSGVAWAQTTFSFLLGVHYMKLPPGTNEKVKAAELSNYMSVGM